MLVKCQARSIPQIIFCCQPTCQSGGEEVVSLKVNALIHLCFQQHSDFQQIPVAPEWHDCLSPDSLSLLQFQACESKKCIMHVETKAITTVSVKVLYAIKSKKICEVGTVTDRAGW